MIGPARVLDASSGLPVSGGGTMSTEAAPSSQSPPVRLLGRVGRATLNGLGYTGGLAEMVAHTGFWVWRALTRRKRFRYEAHFAQMMRVGVRSLPLVLLVLLFIGMILALQMAYVLETLGFKEWVGAVVGVGVFRELGPLLTAVVMSGFVGASIAAELGTMVVSEEVMALETTGLNPVWYLVMPRMIASIVMIPVVTIIGNYTAVFGGWLIGVLMLDIPSASYVDMVTSNLVLKDIWTGMVKSVVFAVVISCIACYEGLRVRGGAEGVGRATTRAVVLSIAGIIVADCLMTALFYFTT